ncbi:MAG: DUF3943 domain-containing protein [Gammaproteobacteria bacterium]|nr:DUF3943 domain-containing protein [Gammaproteobacteria bacterium]
MFSRSGFLCGLLALVAATAPAAAESQGNLGYFSYSSALIDQAAAGPANATAGVGLRGHGPLSLSLEADREVAGGDWDGLKQDTFYFAFAQMAVIGVLYLSPQSISGWTAEKKDGYSFEKWKTNIRNVVWDTDKWWINYTLHPYWGGAYYVRASERGYGPTPSFWYSFTLSTMYEFGAEALFEQPSIQDMIFTPGLGFFVGRYFMSVREGIEYREMNGEALTGTDRAKLIVTDPLGAVNRRINSALGRQVSFTLTPAVMPADASLPTGPQEDYAGMRSRELFSGLRLQLIW